MRLIGALLATALMTTAAVAEDTARLTVVGEGRVQAVPDMATLTLGVTAEGETAKAAMDETSAGVSALLAQLAAAGIAPEDIQTSSLSVNPQWSGSSYGSGENEITGYVAMNTVTVRVRALDSVGSVIDGAMGQGANTFNGLFFGLQNPEPRLDEARAAAVADARRKAELYARAAGVDLGSIASISEETVMSGPQPMFRMDTAMASESVPVAPGEMSLSARIVIQWEIGG